MVGCIGQRGFGTTGADSHIGGIMFSGIPSRGFKLTEKGEAFLESKALGGFRNPSGKKEKEHSKDLDKLDEGLFQALVYLTFEKDSFIYSRNSRYISPSAVFRLLRFGYIEEDEEVVEDYKVKEKRAQERDKEIDKYFRMGLTPPDSLFEDEEE